MSTPNHSLLSLWQAAFGIMILFSGCDEQSQPGTVSSSDLQPPATDIATIRRFCGDCHGFPSPDTYPADVWPEKVREGFAFYRESLRGDLRVPDVTTVEQFFVANAPEKMALPAADSVHVSIGRQSVFGTAETFVPGVPLTAVSSLNHSNDSLLVSDMRSGDVWNIAPGGGSPAPPSLTTSCLSACRVEATDLDDNGETDYVIADLGSFLPEDHSLGAVWYIYRDEKSGTWTQEPLIQELGRVADVRAMDADGDGDTDLVVAEFGWHKTGQIVLLRNSPSENGSPQMTAEVIDDRHGAIHTPVTDINGDGHPDFIALISQEFESVVAFINRGNGTFDTETIYRSDNPGFGSCGIALSDIDGDSDVDVAFVNGDSLDTPILKPYHSVAWLENTGTFPFEFHEISRLPGGYCVHPADVDDDGDVDLTVVTLLPEQVREDYSNETFHSVVWFEQTAPKVFEGHSLEQNQCHHAACHVVDWDQDGDQDLIVADMTNDASTPRPLTIFRNQKAQSRKQ